MEKKYFKVLSKTSKSGIGKDGMPLSELQLRQGRVTRKQANHRATGAVYHSC